MFTQHPQQVGYNHDIRGGHRHVHVSEREKHVHESHIVHPFSRPVGLEFGTNWLEFFPFFPHINDLASRHAGLSHWEFDDPARRVPDLSL